jgi:HlyD family secretion protein
LTEHAVGVPVPGRLHTITVEEGDRVKQGQVLATVDRAEQAERDYERVRTLFEQGGTTQQAVEQAALAWSDQRIVSPVDGVVLVKIREPGEVVAAGSPVLVIGDRRRMWVRVFVPEGQINRVHLQQSATLGFDGLKQSFPGHVSYVSPEAEFTPRNVQTTEERVTQTFTVKVELDTLEPFLRPGVAADVTINLAD